MIDNYKDIGYGDTHLNGGMDEDSDEDVYDHSKDDDDDDDSIGGDVDGDIEADIVNDDDDELSAIKGGSKRPSTRPTPYSYEYN